MEFSAVHIPHSYGVGLLGTRGPVRLDREVGMGLALPHAFGVQYREVLINPPFAITARNEQGLVGVNASAFCWYGNMFAFWASGFSVGPWTATT